VTSFTDALAAYTPVSLEEMDARAAFQRRVDSKFLLPAERFAAVAEDLRSDHDALEAAGTREARYESVYFDTPGLRCFDDHVEGTLPRFKIRTRLYVDGRACSFEVKIKQGDGETTKQQLPYDPAEHATLTPEARAFADRSLHRCAGRPAPEHLVPALTTRFRRATLVARDGSERVTCDLELRLVRSDGGCAELVDHLVLVEVKSEAGTGRCERLLRDAGVDEVSVSKYRSGIALLAREDPSLGGDAARCFSGCAGRR
jgi:VTC domain